MRGLDLPALVHVLSLRLPRATADFLMCTGCTGRAVNPDIRRVGHPEPPRDSGWMVHAMQ